MTQSLEAPVKRDCFHIPVSMALDIAKRGKCQPTTIAPEEDLMHENLGP